MCLDELIDGGRTLADCEQLVAAFTADGTIDYFSLDIGDNWGRVSYIPAGVYDEAEWAPLCGQVRQATDLPVVYVGRVTSLASAEAILAAEQADLVGFARALIADPDLINKSVAGHVDEVRPCIALQECIDRRVVENLPFACGVNPRAGRDDDVIPDAAARALTVLVVGGGPAGTEFAAHMAEHGHRVQLWEQSAELGGQLAVAALLRMNAQYRKWLPWQRARLERAGVDVHLARRAEVETVLAVDADVVAVATGARARRPDVPGLELPHVMMATDVATGAAEPGHRVLVVSEDDRLAPLAVVDHLAGAGHEVTLAYQSLAPSPLVGKYTIGAVMARLDDAGVRTLAMTRLVSVRSAGVTLANVYSGRRFELDEFDSVVLACGAVPVDDLFHALRPRHERVHLLGDAFAPRRMVFATRQAYELARIFDRDAATSR